jgi:NTP pyrophosphatase (non-canonical NTP hydrolase)
MTIRRNAIDIVINERIKQEIQREEGRFRYTPLSTGMTEPEKLACITTEIGEVAENVQKRAHLVSKGDMSDSALITELSQVAALCVAWMENLLGKTTDAEEGSDRRKEHRTGAELTKMGIDDRRRYTH